MKNGILLILLSLLCALLFFFINQMTPHPGRTSGNGNPAIPIIAVLFLLFCYLVVLWVKVSKNVVVNRLRLIFPMVLIVIYWIFGILYQKNSFIVYRNVLANAHKEKYNVNDWEYINQITSFMSIHVNNQYFNVNTFLLFITASLFIALLFKLLRATSFYSK